MLQISGNETDSAVRFLSQTGGYYKIKLANYDAYLTAVDTDDGSNVKWLSSQDSDLQVWSLVSVGLEQREREKNEYQLIASCGNTVVLAVDSFYRLTSDTRPYGARYSALNQQRWLIKGTGSNIKIYSKQGDEYLLCNCNERIYGRALGGAQYLANVKHSPTEEESCMKMIPYTGAGNNQYEIQHTATGLYLTYYPQSAIRWMAHEPLTEDREKYQVWQLRQQYAYNEHNGIDTSAVLSETTCNALVFGRENFAARYYAPIKLNEVEIENLDVDQIDVNSVTINQVTFHEKSLTPSEVSRIRSKGIKIVSIYQDNGQYISDFSEINAKNDAVSALISARVLGQPTGSAIYFAVDNDFITTFDVEKIRHYFETIQEKFLNTGYYIGVYGSGRICSLIKQQLGIATYSFLSHSSGWSGYNSYDNILSYNIKQGESYVYNNVTVDDDTATTSELDNYGEW